MTSPLVTVTEREGVGPFVGFFRSRIAGRIVTSPRWYRFARPFFPFPCCRGRNSPISRSPPEDAVRIIQRATRADPTLTAAAIGRRAAPFRFWHRRSSTVSRRESAAVALRHRVPTPTNNSRKGTKTTVRTVGRSCRRTYTRGTRYVTTVMHVSIFERTRGHAITGAAGLPSPFFAVYKTNLPRDAPASSSTSISRRSRA